VLQRKFRFSKVYLTRAKRWKEIITTRLCTRACVHNIIIAGMQTPKLTVAEKAEVKVHGNNNVHIRA